MKVNIFIENIYEDFELDEVKFHNDAKKMFNYAISLDEVKENYCLKDKSFKTIVFDIVLCNDDEIHRINKEYIQIGY